MTKPDSYLYDENSQTNFFINLFSNYDIKGKIIEFGPGAGYGIYIGKKLGYDITGIDIYHEKMPKEFMNFTETLKELNVYDNVKFYDGIERLPFNDNEFDIMISKASIARFRYTKDKFYDMEKQKRTKIRFKELIRITKPKGKWFVITQKTKWTKKYLNMYDNKNINLTLINAKKMKEMEK